MSYHYQWIHQTQPFNWNPLKILQNGYLLAWWLNFHQSNQLFPKRMYLNQVYIKIYFQLFHYFLHTNTFDHYLQCMCGELYRKVCLENLSFYFRSVLEYGCWFLFYQNMSLFISNRNLLLFNRHINFHFYFKKWMNLNFFSWFYFENDEYY